MNKNAELLKNTIIIFLGKASTQLLSFLLLPFYTAFLSTSDYGTVDLIITYVQLLVPVLTLELEIAAFRFLIDQRKDPARARQVIHSLLLFLSLIAGAFVVLYGLVTAFVAVPYRGLILLNVLVSIYSTNLLQIARGLGENIRYSLACCICGGVTVLSNLYLIAYRGMGADGMLISMLLANAISSLYLIVRLRLPLFAKGGMDTALMREMTAYSLPLVPNLISWWIISVSDRSIISMVLTVAANGIYSVANKFSTVFIGVYNVFNLSWTESAVLHYEDDDRDTFFSETINGSFRLFAAGCLLIIAAMPFGFGIFVKPQYADAYVYIPILMLSALCNVVVGQFSVFYVIKKLSNQLAKTSVVAAVVNVGTHLLLVRALGLYAAAVSTFVSYFSLMVLRYLETRKFFRYTFDRAFLLTFLPLLVPVLAAYYSRNLLFCGVMLAVSTGYSVWMNREKMKFIVKKLRKR